MKQWATYASAVACGLVGLVFLVSERAWCGDATFEASVDKNPVGLGDQFTLSFTLKNAGMGGGKNLQLPDLSKFFMMGGPNQSSSMEFINGAVSSSLTYGYVLQPKEIGKFTIGVASIETGGKVYQSNPLTLEVVKGAPPRSKQQANAPVDLSADIGENLLLKASVDKTHVLQGEQINVSYKIYTRVQVTNYVIDKNPALTGFWGEEVENPKQISPAPETINGKQYSVGLIRRVALFPTQSGTLEISPMEIQAAVLVRSKSRDPFDSFFGDPFSRSVNYKVKSEPIKITVDPLPRDAPPGFKGAIGEFAMSTSVDKKTTRTNEPTTLKVTITGKGNIKLLEAPELELPADFEQYTPKISDNINRGEGRIWGTKTFEYLLIPRNPGLKIIKPLMFSYFDIAKREYITLRSPQLELNVEQGAATTTPFIAGAAREDVRLLSQDIRFIKVGGASLIRNGLYLYASGAFVALLVLPLAGFAGAFVFARQRQAVMADKIGYRNRQAMKIARKGLKQAEQLLTMKTGASAARKLRFYSEIARALWKYLGDKLNIQRAELSIESAVRELRNLSVDNGVVHSLQLLLEQCEMARFAPTSLEPYAMQKTYDEAKRIIVEIERTLKSR